MAAAIHLPLMAAYCASKAGVEALGDCLRVEMRPYGARVGVAYFAEIDTDMTTRGFDIDAARRLTGERGVPSVVTPLPVAVERVVEAIATRRRTVMASAHARAGLTSGGGLQRLAEAALRSCAYELDHHRRLARRAGLSEAATTRVEDVDGVTCCDARQSALLRFVDQMVLTGDVDDLVWRAVAEHLTERQLIELCLLVAQYAGLATVIFVLRIERDV